MSSQEPDDAASSRRLAATQLVQDKLTHSLLTKVTMKRKDSDDGDPTPGDQETYKSYGRHLARTCTPFTRIHVIADYGVRTALAAEAALDNEGGPPPPPKPAPSPSDIIRDQRLATSWEIICDTIPGFREEMIDLGGATNLRRRACAEIQAGVDGARGDDSGKMKPHCITWAMNNNPDPNVTAADIAALTSKLARGFNSLVTAKLLCPKALPATAETFAKIKAGEIKINARQMPHFMYADNHPYNPDDIEDGLLEGPLPVAAAKQLYQGPQAALQGPGFHRGKAGNAGRHGQEALGARDIGYACTQLYFSLSSLSAWSAQDGTFNYAEFYWSVVDIFKDGEGQGILDHFNYQVFGTAPQTAIREVPEAAPEPSAFDMLAAQRAAKRARAAQSSQ
ncbi:hypothetical protein C8R44DRAFT_991690 [Mycena epipterygia]|nr:hypothetical protein C8R44DRAFT_991690 [Mycena epipterygia]